MATKNKRRGYEGEVFVCKAFEDADMQGEYAWGSDGRAMGLTSADDGLLDGRRWQCKRFMHRNVPKWFKVNALDYFAKGIEVVTFYIDKAKGHKRQVYAIIKLEDYIELCRQSKSTSSTDQGQGSP